VTGKRINEGEGLSQLPGPVRGGRVGQAKLACRVKLIKDLKRQCRRRPTQKNWERRGVAAISDPKKREGSSGYDSRPHQHAQGRRQLKTFVQVPLGGEKDYETTNPLPFQRDNVKKKVILARGDQVTCLRD